ncbi:ATP-dependent helicase HrpB [Luteococcus peritonei]|uniref:RNA helicase n=1 Tax=Luteococcus peritonei TaxID=88874 RepID=A0ABW4RV10_9ACTN
MTFDLAAIGAGLPVLAAREELEQVLRRERMAVVQAPPGTGKTTLVPPLVAEVVAQLASRDSTEPGRVVVTQPRRIAARAAARRLGQLSAGRPGEPVGFTVRGESTATRRTAVEFVTTGVLLRRLLADPGLDGTAAVVLDEVHERALDSDLVFAMLVELRELRPDLLLVVMSATLDAARWAGLLGGAQGPAPVVAVATDLHPLEVRWSPTPPGTRRLDDRGLTPAFLDHLAATAREALASTGEGNVLVFVPGAREADRVAERLQGQGIEAQALSGSLDARAQDAVLTDRPGRRVIVATAVAESSLTVPGVRAVVDSGLSREPRYDTGRRMGGLVTVSEPRSSAEQRAGRAARLGPGLVIRCFPESDWPRLRPFTVPEIATADLTGAALDLACWGSPGGHGLALPDPPPPAAMAGAVATLTALGALDEGGRATDLGRRIASVPADPRLARALLEAAPLVGSRAAAGAVAMLAGDERAPGGDLERLLRELRSGRGPAAHRWRREADRLESLVGQQSGEPAGALGLVVAMAHPDRIARRRGPDSTAYLTTGGTGAGLEQGSALRGQEWLAVAEMARARTSDASGAVIRAAVPITRELAEQAAEHLRTRRVEARFESGRVAARSLDLLGAVELAATPVAPSVEQGREAVLQVLRERGLGLDGPGLLEWGEGPRVLRARLGLLHRVLGDPWPAVDETSLLECSDEWLAPELDRLATGTPAPRLDLTSALRRLLPWPEAGRLDELAPERIEVPTGSLVRLAYPEDPADRVVLAVKLQECFGLLETPRILDGRVPVLMHLLSPAQRPLAVTDDLASFWANAYPAVRAENRGRYRKHPWPDDPLSAAPRRGTTKSGH